jgi:hypothetical protein
MTGDIKSKFYFGKDSKKGYFASVYTYRPRNENILERKGEIFAVLRLRTDPDFDLMTAGGILLDYFHETYFEIQEKSPMLALEKTVISSSKHLAKLIDKDKKISDTGIEMELIATSIVGENAYFVNVGDNGLFIFRNKEFVDLKPALKDPNGRKEVEVASMKLLPNDRLLLATEAVVDLVSKQQLQKLLKKFDLDDFPQKSKNDHEQALVLIGYEVDSKGESDDDEAIPAVPMTVVEDVDAEVAEVDADEEVLGEVEPDALEMDEELEAIADDADLKDAETKDEDLEKGDSEGEQDKSDDENEIYEKTHEESVSNEPTDKTKVSTKPKTYKVLMTNFTAKLKALPTIIKSKKRPSVGSSNPSTKFIILGIIIVLSAGALYIGVRQAIKNNEDKVRTEEVNVSLDLLKEKVEAIEEIVDDLKLADSTEKRQQGINEVQSAYEEIDKVKDVESVKSEVEEYKSRVAKAEDYFNRIIAVTSDDKLVDVGSYFPDAKISDITYSADSIYLTDAGLGKVYSVSYDGKEIEEIVSGLKNPTSITYDPKGFVIYVDESDDNQIGIYSVESKTTRRLTGTSASRVGEIGDIEYAEISSGRIYLIDKTNKRMMYMEKSGDNYGLPASRFTLEEFTSGRDLYIIDNKIYALADFKQGLYRFFNGQDDTPELIGMTDGMDMRSATGLYVDGTNIYFSNPVTNSVAVFDKGIQTAKFKGQFKSKDTNIFSGIKDLVVVSSKGKIYTVDQSVIYQLDLAQLNEL